MDPRPGTVQGRRRSPRARKDSAEGVATYTSRHSTGPAAGFVVLSLYVRVNHGNPLREGVEWRVVHGVRRLSPRSLSGRSPTGPATG